MRRYPERPIVGVGAVVLCDGRVVLVKRAHEPLKGAWSLPGGTVEIGESVVAAVSREVLEETGLVVRVGPLIDVVDRIHRTADGRVEYHFIVADYLCTVEGGALARGSDAAEVAWVGTGDLSAHGLTDQALDIVRQALALAAPSGSR